MKICHIGNLPLDKMGDITRVIHDKCEGNHIYHQGPDSLPPDSNIYVLHCFKKNWEDYFNYVTLNPKSKIVSLVHSSFPCQPSRYSDYIVTITEAAAKHLRLTTELRSTVIPGAIDLTEFLRVEPDYEFPVMGKMSRNEPGKFHPQYWEILSLLGRKYGGSTCLISPERPAGYEGDHISGVGISKHKDKAQALRRLNIYADAHNVGPEAFVETLCTSTLEAMACGIPVVLLSTQQPAMVEVVGDGGLVVDNIYEFYLAVEFLAGSEQARREWGHKARERAKEWNDLGKMITSWNNLFSAAMGDVNQKFTTEVNDD
jgi:glycosyltransferase involved in cell wall biosynthesis